MASARAKKKNPPQGLSGKTTVIVAVAALFIAGFLLRAEGFSRPHKFSFDEDLFAYMGYQLSQNITDYTSVPFYKVITESGREVPEQYNRPLFAHPPLYSYLISLVNRFSDPTDRSSEKGFSLSQARRNGGQVSLFLGSLTILVVFFIGKRLYDDRVGLLAALLLAIDPVHWICSQKIWMETTLTFFVALSLLFFILGRTKRPWFLLCGVCIGLASLTKLIGLLPLAVIVAYAALIERSLFRTREFILCLIAPFIFLMPWFLWNYAVYGFDFAQNNQFISVGIRMIKEHLALLAMLIVVAGLVIGLPLLKSGFVRTWRPRIQQGLNPRVSLVVLALPFLVFLLVYIRDVVATVGHLFAWGYIPSHGKVMRMFASEPWHFYLRRLVEYSPLILFAYLSLFLLRRKNKGDVLLILGSIVIMTFFILWGNFQCRYILPVIPLLAILSARQQVCLFDLLRKNPKRWAGIALVLLSMLALYFCVKTMWMGFAFALPNEPYYF